MTKYNKLNKPLYPGMGFDSSMTRTKTDAELRVIIKRIVKKHDLGLVAITRNIQGSVDVELDDGNNIFYADRDAIEEEIRTIKGAVINDIFLAGGYNELPELYPQTVVEVTK